MSVWHHGLDHKPFYRIHWATPDYICFRDVRTGRFGATDYLLPRSRWAHMVKGYWP